MNCPLGKPRRNLQNALRVDTDGQRCILFIGMVIAVIYAVSV